MTTDSFVVKPLRFPGRLDRRARRQRHRQRSRHGRRPAAGADRVDDPRGGARLRRAARRGGGDRRRRARAAGVEIVGGDTKVVERGAADGCTSARPASARSIRALADGHRRDPAGRQDPRLGPDRRARHGDHARAQPVRPRRRDRVRHLLAVAGGRRAARQRPARSCTACATPPAAEWPRCSTSWPGHPEWRWWSARPTFRFRRSLAAAAELLGIDPMYVANEGRLVAFVAPRGDGRRRWKR